jgi:hypothetical protein
MKKNIMLFLFVMFAFNFAYAQDAKVIKLSEPNKKGGLSVLEALSLRASVREWADKSVSMETLSDLLWAANGINRENKKRTAASAMNAQDVDIYVFLKEGVYLYDAANHALNPVVSGAHQSEIGMARKPGGPGGPGGPGKPGDKPGSSPNNPPQPTPGAVTTTSVELLLVSDYSKFGGGTEVLKKQWGAIDAGLVAQNVMIYCAGNGLATHPKAAIEENKMKSLLKLKDTQIPLLDLPIGYPVK